jgi:hypothetical protein
MDIFLQRCKRHAQREAAARCPECKCFFCRECVTEHDDKVICSDCLLKLTGKSEKRSLRLRWALRGAGAFVGLFILWLSFYYLGQLLLSIPADFHEGTLWTETNWKTDNR